MTITYQLARGSLYTKVDPSLPVATPTMRVYVLLVTAYRLVNIMVKLTKELFC